MHEFPPEKIQTEPSGIGQRNQKPNLNTGWGQRGSENIGNCHRVAGIVPSWRACDPWIFTKPDTYPKCRLRDPWSACAPPWGATPRQSNVDKGFQVAPWLRVAGQSATPQPATGSRSRVILPYVIDTPLHETHDWELLTSIEATRS